MRPETILKAVSEHTGISIEDIKSKSKKYEIMDGVNLYFYLCKRFHKRLSENLVYSAKLINRKSYTLYNGYKRIKGFMDVDISFEMEVLRLEKSLLPKVGKTLCKPCITNFITV